MCGICGIVGAVDKKILIKIINSLTHRGPNDWGYWINNQSKIVNEDRIQVGLGHRRLSIIDLSPAGHQPMSNEDETIWIVYNGETYNFQDIKTELQSKGHQFKSKSDTEVIIHAYEEWSTGCLQKFNGMFAFALWDEKNQILFLARDRLGIKPLYYSHAGSSFIFSSEIKAILASSLINNEPDLFALHTPTRFQISPLTGFKNIYKLSPGHYLTFKDGKLSIHKYWTIEPKEKHISFEEAQGQLEEKLLTAIQLQMIADVEVGAFLSGGVDSSLITALMAKQTGKKIQTFTIKFRKEDQKFEKMPDDSYFAKRVADYFGFRHNEFEIEPDIVELLHKIIWHLDEPLTDPAAINTYIISQAARNAGIIVLLNGMGGDEIFGGYRKQLACLKAETYQKLVPDFSQEIIRSLLKKIPVGSNTGGFRYMRWLKRFASFASLPPMERFLSSDLSLNPGEYDKLFKDGPSYWETHFYNSQLPNFNGNGLSYLTQMCLNDTLIFLPEHNLNYSDKATMAASVESRPPFTDHNVVEFMFTLPPRFRIKGNQQKYLLRKVAEKYLPQEIVYRPKAPFGSPLRAWIRGPLKTMVDDYLSDNSIKKRGLYNAEYVRSKINLDREGKEDNAHLIWTFLTNEIWFRTFFD